MIDFIAIKKALVELLKSIEMLDVSFESIPIEQKDYWFVDLLPISGSSVGSTFTNISYLVDITCCKQNASNENYMKINMELDQKIRPCFHFGERYITVDDATMNIVDHASHYTFKIDYIPSVEDLETGTPAEQLEVKY